MKNNFSFKVLAKEWILQDIIKSTLRSQSSAGLVAILDKDSSSLISQYVTSQEIIEAGVTFVENINVKRKPYPKLSAIYIISPTKQNLDYIQQDFGSHQIYSKLNIYFTSKIPTELIKTFKTYSSAKKVKIFKEINLNFKIDSDFVFRPISNSQEDKGRAILSAVSGMRNISTIQIITLKNNNVDRSNETIKLISDELSQLMPLIEPKNEEQGSTLYLFLFDREYDLITPLIHDFYYENLLKDFINLDYENISIKGQSYKIHYDDTVYKKYAYNFIQEAKQNIVQDYQELQKTNETAKYLRKNQDDFQAQKLKGVFEDMAEYNDLILQYGCHLKLSSKVMEEIDSKNLKQLADFEYSLVTGIGEGGEKVTKEEKRDRIMKEFNNYFNGDPLTNRLRLVLISKGSLISDPGLLGLLESEEKQIFTKFEKLVQKYGNYWPEEKKNELRKIAKQKFDDNPTSLDRYVSKLEYYLDQYLRYGDDKDFNKTIIGQKVEEKKSRGKTYFPNQFYKGDLLQNKGSKKLLVFIDGGISRVEIRILKNYVHMDTKERYEVIAGGDDVTTPKEYISNFIMKSN